MAKMRVHELAKELDIKSQDIIDLLSNTEYAVKSASSGLEDEAQAKIRPFHRQNTGKLHPAMFPPTRYVWNPRKF